LQEAFNNYNNRNIFYSCNNLPAPATNKIKNMATLSENKPKELDLKWYRFAYGAFVLLSFYFLLVSKDLSAAVSNWGIALVFDPFDQRVKWSDRPLWQKIWLLIHLLVMITGFAVLLTR